MYYISFKEGPLYLFLFQMEAKQININKSFTVIKNKKGANTGQTGLFIVDWMALSSALSRLSWQWQSIQKVLGPLVSSTAMHTHPQMTERKRKEYRRRESKYRRSFIKRRSSLRQLFTYVNIISRRHNGSWWGFLKISQRVFSSPCHTYSLFGFFFFVMRHIGLVYR
jgi:hypothetical protein